MKDFLGDFFMVNLLIGVLKVKIFPDEYMIQIMEQNIGNSRFLGNNLLSRYNELYR